MKTIEIDNKTKNRVNSLLNKIVDIYYDANSCTIKTNSNIYIFFNTDEIAETVNNSDEAIILTSEEESVISEFYKFSIHSCKVTRIYKVITLLFFEKSHKITLKSKLKDFFESFKSKTAFRLFWILLRNKKEEYFEIVKNPDNVINENNYPSNLVHTGYLLELNANKCFPLFSDQNSIFMYKYVDKDIECFMKENNEFYRFDLVENCV